MYSVITIAAVLRSTFTYHYNVSIKYSYRIFSTVVERLLHFPRATVYYFNLYVRVTVMQAVFVTIASRSFSLSLKRRYISAKARHKESLCIVNYVVNFAINVPSLIQTTLQSIQFIETTTKALYIVVIAQNNRPYRHIRSNAQIAAELEASKAQKCHTNDMSTRVEDAIVLARESRVKSHSKTEWRRVKR